ncbi:MAG: TPM domain-containing protein [Bacillota bacterium]|nr:TPM domain-containing protein [Bacillota bacterium]
MKNKIYRILLVFLMLGLLVRPIHAEEDYNTSIYHFNDMVESISDQAYIDENKKVDRFIQTYNFDLATFIITEEYYADYGFDTYLKGIYTQNEMGYGINQDGIILGIDALNQTFMVETFGRGNVIFTSSEIKDLYEVIQQGYANNRFLGAQEAYRNKVEDILATTTVFYETEEKEYPEGPIKEIASLNKGETIVQDSLTRPEWYDKDPATLNTFHTDESTPRLIDQADILTEKEEESIKSTLKHIYNTYHQDVVVYTDVTSYGMDNEIYSQDYYVYNGYGYGDNYDGLILFVNMNPNDREMVTSFWGSAQPIFNAKISNSLDDILYDHFVQQEYGKGVQEWLVGVEDVLQYGIVNPPSWIKEPVKNAPLLVDELGYFDEQTKQKIEKELKSLKQQYGYDFVIYLAKEASDLSNEDLNSQERIHYFIDAFYQAHGYSENSVVYALFPQEISIYTVNVRPYGKAQEQFDSSICSRLEDFTELDIAYEDNYEENVEAYLSYLHQFLETGRLPHSWFTRILWGMMCLLAGCLAGGISLSRAKAKMKTVKKGTEARQEMVDNSFKVRSSNDIYVNTTVSRVYKPRNNDNNRSSGSSSGRTSSYSSSTHSSSGRSVSSSRRKF